MALPDVFIIATNSPVHNKHVVSLGANTCVDRNLEGEELVTAIKASTPSGKGVSAILDAVGAATIESLLFQTLDPEGAKMYTNVFTGREVDVPKGVERKKVFAHMMFTTPEAVQGGMCAMSRLVDIVEEGRYKLSVEVDVVGKGLESIGGGLEMLRRGVSGRKLVVAL
jgi:NADPH:quinone reductase-like Zn-dependent oxidoreductase